MQVGDKYPAKEVSESDVTSRPANQERIWPTRYFSIPRNELLNIPRSTLASIRPRLVVVVDDVARFFCSGTHPS